MKRVAGLLLAALGTLAQAQSVTLTGTIGNRAIVIVNGAPPKTLAVGESTQGVRLVSLQGEQAMVEAGGQRYPLRMDSPTSVGGSGTRSNADGKRVVLPADSGGHFMGQGAINGRPVSFMLDTGATLVAMSQADATRIGLDFKTGEPVRMNTANGQVQAYRVRLGSVRLGDVEIYDVEALVSPEPMPWVLLGNSFISRFSMRRDADQMVLEKRF